MCRRCVKFLFAMNPTEQCLSLSILFLTLPSNFNTNKCFGVYLVRQSQTDLVIFLIQYSFCFNNLFPSYKFKDIIILSNTLFYPLLLSSSHLRIIPI